jgi:endonuclease/exonuclease/phosphatase family metal-dependent hydrolase
MKDSQESHHTISKQDKIVLRTRLHARAIAAFVMALLLPLLLCSAPRVQSATGPQPSVQPATQSASRLTVMSFNLHGGNSNQYHDSGCNPAHMPVNMDKFKQVIQRNGAAVVIANEIHKRQARDLARSLGFPDPHFVWTKICNDSNRDLDYGNAILSRYPLTDRLYYSPHTSDGDKARREYTRLVAATISVGGYRIRIYATHLTAGGSDLDRQKQVGEILQTIPLDEAWAGVGNRSILGGDMNFTPNSIPYKKLVTLYRDAWAEWNANIRSGATEPAAAPANRFDYILWQRSNGFKVELAKVVDICDGNICLADHRPMLAQLALK